MVAFMHSVPWPSAILSSGPMCVNLSCCFYVKSVASCRYGNRHDNNVLLLLTDLLQHNSVIDQMRAQCILCYTPPQIQQIPNTANANTYHY